MNRTIKFRGKSRIDGEWFYGNLFVKDTEGRTHICIPERGCLCIDPDTVGQFTGLKDKNGKEIYEGDIFGIPCKDVKNHFYRMVEYCCDGFYLVDNCKDVKYGDLLHREISLDGNYSGMAKELRYSGSDYCVVGNIHDNPELLNEK